MSKNISLLGANYSDVPSVLLPKTGGGTALFADPSVTTAVAADVASGKTFLLADGSIGTGTSSGGGGSSAWTKVAETSYQIHATNTSAATFATWSTGHSELWTSDKWVWVRIRDTAGKRSGYFYGSDNFYANLYPKNGSSTTSVAIAGRMVIRYNNGSYSTTTSTYGVYTGSLSNNGKIEIMTRYNSSNSRTINGTYKVEVYLLDPAGGVPIFT